MRLGILQDSSVRLVSWENLVGVMTFDALGDAALDYLPCRYENSKLLFRGPRQDLSKPYVAFFGGTETYGKFIEMPFVEQLNGALPLNCVNFGCLNAGVDVFLHDPFLPDAARRADVTVLQVPSAQNMTNRLYSVHPRRNDRFVAATRMLNTIFPDVDFAGFHFNKHMLKHLREVSPDRYRIVEQELSHAWTARMETLLTRISGRVVLLWVSARTPDEMDRIEIDPMHVTREMLVHMTTKVTEFVEVTLSPDALAAPLQGMVFNQMEAPAAREMLGLQAHNEVFAALHPVLERMLQ